MNTLPIMFPIMMPNIFLPVIHKVDDFGHNPLYYLCMEKNITREVLNSIVYLITNGADVNCMDEIGDTILSSVITVHTDSEIRYRYVLLLLSAGANPNLCKPGALTPLMNAVILGDIRVVDLLVRHGADINARFVTDSPLLVRDKSTALSIAAQDMNIELVTFFLHSGRLSPEVIFHTLHNSPHQMREFIRTIQGY